MATHRIRLHFRTVAITLAAATLLGAAGGVAALYAGWYNVSALRQHFGVVHAMFDVALGASVRRHAQEVKAPPLTAPMVTRGATVYSQACAHCHGGPGIAPADWGKSMQPAPGSLVDAARRWTAEELYWVTRNGIRMTGMPAWEYHLSDQDLWAVTAFVREMPALSASAYRQMTQAAPSAGGATLDTADTRPVGDAVRGGIAITQYACQTCHIIPGVVGAQVYVGRPLIELARRKLIAGHLPNTEANLVRWLMDPQAIDPDTAMPNLGLTERDARDIAAYLLKH